MILKLIKKFVYLFLFLKTKQLKNYKADIAFKHLSHNLSDSDLAKRRQRRQCFFGESITVASVMAASSDFEILTYEHPKSSVKSDENDSSMP